MKHKFFRPLLAAACLALLAACAAAPQAGSAFVLGDPTFSAEHEQTGIDPAQGYSGWACLRYGVGETLFRYTDAMEPEPWLAAGYERTSDTTWVITLREGITFSSGRALDGRAVRQSLERLVAANARARADLDIAAITAAGQTVTITTATPRPALLNALSDPYACIVDTQAGAAEGLAVGTGPYVAVGLTSGEQLDLVKNETYWNGTPGYDSVTVLTIADTDTLALALQAGEIDAAYGLPYASYPLFQNEGYNISTAATSRTFFAELNFESPLLQDPAVRRAIALGIDKERFVQQQLGGHGYAAAGAFPQGMAFGGDAVQAAAYDPDAARALLEQAGWVDTDGDGVREKDGQKLVLRWLTYPSRPELPLLAQAAQATLGEIGFAVQINSTADHNRLRADPTAWDVYASAMVTAPTGDPAYFFAAHCLDDSPANNGHYHSDELQALAAELDVTFDPARRAELAVAMQQILLDDSAFVFCSHLQMSLVSRADVAGLTAHPSDYYEITAALRPAA